jgi:hypothetical protein
MLIVFVSLYFLRRKAWDYQPCSIRIGDFGDGATGLATLLGVISENCPLTVLILSGLDGVSKPALPVRSAGK